MKILLILLILITLVALLACISSFFSIKKKYLLTFLIPLLLIVSYLFASSAFNDINKIHQIRNIPLRDISLVVKGVVNLNGKADSHQGRTLKAPESKADTLIYKYTLEKKETRNDKTTWVTQKAISDQVPFIIQDHTGSILIEANQEVEKWLKVKHQIVYGNLRHTEYRIDKGDNVFVMGNAEGHAGKYHINFKSAQDYSPLISSFDDTALKGHHAVISLLKTWAAFLTLGGVFFICCYLLKVTSTISVLAIITSCTFIGLGIFSFNFGKINLETSQRQYRNHLSNIKEEIQTTLAAHNIVWSGDWEDLGSFTEEKFETLPHEVKERLINLRLYLATTVFEIQKLWDSIPENIVSKINNFPKPELLALPLDDLKKAQQTQKSYLLRTSTSWWGIALCILALLGGVLSQRFGLKKIKKQRLIENIPTSQSKGVTYGVAELKGIAIPLEKDETLLSPYFSEPCLFYKATKSYYGSDRKKRVETLTDRKSFYVQDQEGRFFILTKDATIFGAHISERKEKNITFKEEKIHAGDTVYAIGSARINPETHNSLYLCKDNTPFIITNMEENDLRFKKSIWGLSFLYLSFLFYLAAAFSILGMLGMFSGISYILAALVGPIFLLTCFAFLIFNDFVFLENQLERTWSNIKVSLQKRNDLIPKLETIVKTYLNHEKDLQKKLATLRNYKNDPSGTGEEEASAYLLLEQQTTNQLLGLTEKYPELLSIEHFKQLMNVLRDTENEIALMKEGYNNTVERYNTRREQFPESIIARAFTFDKAEFFNSYKV